jgi:hypothetical protein
MLIDHFGLIFFPSLIGFRIIGRFSFPLFAWLISTGYFHTGNVFKYLRRLIVLAVIIQIPYSLYFKSTYLNIFFTLFVGLLVIYFYDSLKNRTIAIISVSNLLLLSAVLNFDYGVYGVLTIFLFYFFHKDFKKMIFSQLLLNIFNLAVIILFDNFVLTKLDIVQPFSLLALIIIFLYNGRKGQNFKYVFYVFYPAHLLFMYAIKLIIDR